MRAGAPDSIPGFETRKGVSKKPNRYISGPSILVRPKEGNT
jgi:hypothetical protein